MMMPVHARSKALIVMVILQVKDQGSSSYLFNLEAWHQKLLPAAHAFVTSRTSLSSVASTVASKR